MHLNFFLQIIDIPKVDGHLPDLQEEVIWHYCMGFICKHSLIASGLNPNQSEDHFTIALRSHFIRDHKIYDLGQYM